jgi:hypothetical protein
MVAVLHKEFVAVRLHAVVVLGVGTFVFGLFAAAAAAALGLS